MTNTNGCLFIPHFEDLLGKEPTHLEFRIYRENVRPLGGSDLSNRKPYRWERTDRRCRAQP